MTSIESRVIDPVRFARAHSQVKGFLPAAQLKRLDDLLFDRDGAVSYTVEGYTTDKGHPALRIGLTGELTLRCQRCLERLPLPVQVQRTVVLVAGTGELDPLEDEDEDVDTILNAGSLDLHDLVEQEIVLSIPMVPRHSEDACSVQTATARNGVASSQLAALAELKSRRK